MESWAIAAGLSCGLVVYGVLAFGAAFRRSRVPARDAWTTVLWLALSFGLLVAVVELLKRVVPDAPDRWTTDLVRTALRCGILLAVLVPWSALLIRRLGLLQPSATPDEPRDLDEVEAFVE